MSSTAFSLKDIFIYRKTPVFEWSIFMQQKYFSSLVLNTDRNCTHCQQPLKISEFYLATIYNLLLKMRFLLGHYAPLANNRKGVDDRVFAIILLWEENIREAFLEKLSVILEWSITFSDSGKRKSTIIGLYLLPLSFTLEGTIGWAGQNFWGPA